MNTASTRMDRIDTAAQFCRCWRCWAVLSTDDRQYDDGLCDECFHDPFLLDEIGIAVEKIKTESG